MGLESVSYSDVLVVGWSNPRPYKADVFKTETGELVPYDAGISMKLYVGTDEHDCDAVKVRTGSIPAIVQGLGGTCRTVAGVEVWSWEATRGITVRIGYTQRRGVYEAVSLQRVPVKS